MDSFSSFAGTVLGEVSVLSSLMTVIAAAEAIGRNLKTLQEAATRKHRSVAFAFFHGVTKFNFFQDMAFIVKSDVCFYRADYHNSSFPERPSFPS